MGIYRTAQVAKIIGIHPNTVRLYEELKLIQKPLREKNGYRIFTDFHIEQFKLARLAFQIEVLQNGLRKKIIEAVKASADGNFDQAIKLVNDYISQITQERKNAEEAIKIAEQFLSKEAQDVPLSLRRKQTAEYLNLTVDTLRNWEMNGLLCVKRKENGYRIYTSEDIRRLKMIRSLRCANYSLEAILRMLNALDKNPNTDIKKVLNTPKENDDVISVCDKLISSLKKARTNADIILDILYMMKNKFSDYTL